jgi:hypothetical protein
MTRIANIWSSFVNRVDGATTTGFSYFLALASLLQSARLIYILFGGESRIVQFLPDDAFYYCVLARTFADTGTWTFDGTAPATGFHLLLGYFLALVFTIAPKIHIATILLVLFTIGFICYVLSAAALSMLVTECYGRDAILAVFVVFLGKPVFLLPVMGMESGPTMLFASFASFSLLRSRPLSRSPKLLAALYSVGLLGMLSRSDFGLLVFCLLAAYAVGCFSRRELALRQVIPPLVAFGGALTGLGVILGHSLAVSGHMLQSSAEMKLYWSSVSGHQISVPLRFLARMAHVDLEAFHVDLEAFHVVVLLGSLSIFSFVVAWRKRLPIVPLVAAMLIGLSYVVLYKYDSAALQVWYAASFVVPMVIGGAPLFAVTRKLRIAVFCLVGLFVLGSVVTSLRPPWPHQIAMRDGGQLLAARPDLEPVGAWNAGLAPIRK